ncbi:MAG: NfeD family protein [Oscillospiraceae bacterium]|nr:NfeD family protein [Oscillospiraceae bacterium]
MELIWFALLILFVIAEAATVTMVSAWFAIGALTALVASLLGAELWLQVLLFFVASGVSLAALRPIAKKHFNPKLTATNVDALTGKTCVVVTEVDNMAGSGQIRIGDVEWTARSSGNATIPVGTQVKIDRVEGVKVYVTPVMAEVK